MIWSVDFPFSSFKWFSLQSENLLFIISHGISSSSGISVFKNQKGNTKVKKNISDLQLYPFNAVEKQAVPAKEMILHGI